MPSDIEIAWAAGLFEGEGCFTCRRREGLWPAFVCCLQMTDEDVVRRFAAVVGHGSVYERIDRRPPRRPTYAWSVTGQTAEAVAELLMPHLGARRSQTARLLIEQCRPPVTICAACGATFEPRRGRGRPWKFCSDDCREQQRAERDRTEYFRDYHRKRRARLRAAGQTAMADAA
jgi:hypothetical protein